MESRIVESASRGKIVIATKNYLPGDLILEDKPTMAVPKEFVRKCESIPGLPTYTAAYWWFTTRLSVEDQTKVLSMFGPTYEEMYQIIRHSVVDIPLRNPNSPNISTKLTPENVEIFAKLASIMHFNEIGLEKDTLIFHRMSNFAHGCAGNCVYEFEYLKTTIRCRAVRAIHAGEELTYAYLPKRDLQPIWVRRHAYLATKRFTCHCLRCEAPGDDTRQFDCFDPACSGTMMVREPRKREDFVVNHRTHESPSGKVVVTGHTYSGVTYVEPHLLPCTECHRAAPVAYQQQMFALEEKLEAEGSRLAQTVEILFDVADVSGMQRVHKEIQNLCPKLPRRHSLCIPLFRALLRIHRFFMAHAPVYRNPKAEVVAQYRETVRHAADAFLTAQEAILSWPHRTTADALWTVADCCFASWRRKALCAPLYSDMEGKALLQKTLRMFLILDGRNSRHKPPIDTLDSELLMTLEHLSESSPGGTGGAGRGEEEEELCGFCEESPLAAAMKRTRCGTCKAVLYCSAGCQRAHWRLHKKTCLPPSKQ